MAVPLGAMNTAVSPLLLRTVPRELLGRVFATFQPAVQSMSIAGVAVAGWLSSSVLRGLDAVALRGTDAAPESPLTQTSAPGPA